MPVELYYLYDTHCPWSYQVTQLVNQISSAFPKMKINLLHCAHFDGDQKISSSDINEVTQFTGHKFNAVYLNMLSENKNSTLTANLLTWTQNRVPKHSLALLNELQRSHFERANALSSLEEVQEIISALKLSPPAKVFTGKKLTKEAEIALNEVQELQDFIGTQAIPAILLAVDDNLILLNHTPYLMEPNKFIEAIEFELNR